MSISTMKAVWVGLRIALENQTLPPDPLQLDANEMKQIIAFIHVLTDTTNLTKAPIKLPKLGSMRLNNRKIGGSY